MTIKMPFGKYKGLSLTDVPSSYLEWVLLEADNAGNGLKAAIREELERREAEEDGVPPPSAETTARYRAAVKTWYREMAMKYHPDRTLDDGTAMKAINFGYERLLELLALPR